MLELLKKLLWRPFWRTRRRFIKWYQLKFVIPPFPEKKAILYSYKQTYQPTVFVETGTFYGDTTELLKNDFEQLYTIELSDVLAEKARKRFSNDAHIHVMQGDSGEELKKIMPVLNTPALFWLDGHYSGEFFVGDEFIKTAKTNLNTPVMEELRVILSSPQKGHVILIDDARCFNGTKDYPTYEALVKYVESFGIQSTQISRKRDIIRIVPRV